MTSIGRDSSGDEHLVPDGEEDRHTADPLCGCNPDPYHDEGPWWWGHHSTGGESA